MKRVSMILGITLAVIVLSSSCEGLLDGLINFEMGPENVEFEIEPTAQGESFNSYDVVFHDIKEEIEANEGSLDNLDEVILKSATITLLSAEENFNKFESFEVYIETPTLSEKKIAWVEAIPMDVASLDANIAEDNLKDYMLEGEYKVIVKGFVREEITEVIRLNAEIYFKVKV